MQRIPWGTILTTLLIGFALGLAYTWLISPINITESLPHTLRADFKDQYRVAIASAYASTGNLSRAQARLKLLGDPDPVEALNAQAQRLLASGDTSGGANQLAALASALAGNQIVSFPTVSPVVTNPINATPDVNSTPAPTELVFITTDTPQVEQTPFVSAPPTARPTRTTIPTLGAPFTLIGQETFCDTNLPDGLLQILVLNTNRRQLAGMEIRITWDGGSEIFFTGFKPELGNGYADFVLIPNRVYSVQLGAGSDNATSITAPTCQTASGENYFGSVKLTFQQP